VTNGFKKYGFVTSVTQDFVEVMWRGEPIERFPASDADSLVRVGHAESVSPGDAAKTNLEILEALLALDRIKELTEKRMSTVRTTKEKEDLNLLIKRSLDTEGCPWDIAHRNELLRLALEPSTAGLVFKLQERLHRAFCKRH
jgi:hypothetical protein